MGIGTQPTEGRTVHIRARGVDALLRPVHRWVWADAHRRAHKLLRFAETEADGGRDLVVHASATSAGLQRSLDLLAPEGTVIDLSWYGDKEVRLSLGGTFHSGRLTIRASQVGTVSPARSGRRTTADRLALALELLRDPAFDVLITGHSPFVELPDVIARLAAGSLPALCHTITYDDE